MSDDPIRSRIQSLLKTIAFWREANLAGDEDEDVARRGVLESFGYLGEAIDHELTGNRVRVGRVTPRSRLGVGIIVLRYGFVLRPNTCRTRAVFIRPAIPSAWSTVCVV